jgi:error-prone DNA polymerase
MTKPKLVANVAFVELLAKSSFSFLQAASQPEEMVSAAHLLGYRGIGILDCDGFYGSARAHTEAKKTGMALCHGSEVLLENGLRVFLIAKNRDGYGDLSEMLSRAHQRLEADLEIRPQILLEELLQSATHLFAIVPARDIDWNPNGTASNNSLYEQIALLKSVFQDRFYFSAHNFLDANPSLDKTQYLVGHFGAKAIASNEPLFHTAQRKSLLDVLTCIRHRVPLSQAGLLLQSNAERHLKSLTAMQTVFRNHLDWMENTVGIFEQCHFSLDELRYRYPTEWIPEGFTGDTYLEKLVWEGANKKFPKGVSLPLRVQLERELKLIRELEYSDYFLTIWDIVRFARSRGILCQGRGSAANSCVCFILEITSIDPVRMDLLFERFISRERKEPPDIDIDFEHERREEVIQYIYERYGRDRAAISAEVICFRRRSALREVGKVFEIPEKVVESFLTLTHRMTKKSIPAEEFTQLAPHVPAATLHQFLSHSQQILAFPRHIGTHVGGFVLCQERLTRNIVVEKAAMVGRTIVQWDKNDLDALGFVRVDILGLGILSCIRRCFEILEKQMHQPLSLATIPAEDAKVYDQICRGDTVGVFQIESRAQMNMLPRLRPRNFFDLVVEISLVRPGPIQGNMIHPYLKRRSGEEPVEYAHPDLEPILKKTFGVPLFQEQVMKMAMQVAGFTGGQADELRRAMGAWRRSEVGLHSMKERFEQGLIKKGVPREYAERVFSQIQGFAEYGFPESHAASFSILVYATAWLRCYYPDVYLTAILNAQPMGFYPKRTLIHDAEWHGVKVRGVSIQKSGWHNRLEQRNQMRLGFREVSGLQQKVGLAIESARGDSGAVSAEQFQEPLQETPQEIFQEIQCGAPFMDLSDFIQRVSEKLKPVPLTKRDLFLLASAHAFDCFGISRRQALWKIQGLHLQDSPWQSFQPGESEVDLPTEKKWEQITLDYQAQAVCITDHPVAFLRPHLKENGVVNSKALMDVSHGKTAKVAGLVVCRQMPPTAKGVMFITLEDEFGFSNVIVWNDLFNKNRATLLENSFLIVTGKVQRSAHGKVVNILFESAEGALGKFPGMSSHDFG